jgi:hypothetical protein
MDRKWKHVPSYIFDLDLPASKRWISILMEYKEIFPKITETINTLLKMNPIVHGVISMIIHLYKDKIMYYDELLSISKITNIEFNNILLMQLLYEASSACTTVVTKVNNKNVFFRTMDWDMNILKDLTITLEFKKNNKTLFFAPTWIGCVGIFTAYIPDKYAISINWKSNNGGLLKNVMKVLTMHWPVSYLLRDICETNHDTKHMINRLQTSTLVSSCYYNIFFPNDKPMTIIRHPTTYITLVRDYIIQTNCDYDCNEPNVLYSVERRNIIQKYMMDHNNNFDSYDQILKLLCIYPIINEETIYLTVINEDSHMTTMV